MTTILATGNKINESFGYASEQVSLRRGLNGFNTVGLAIVDPERPSKDLPFFSPSKQKARQNLAFTIPAGVYVTRVGVRIPKNVVLQPDSYEIGIALGDANNIIMAYAAPTIAGKFDYSVGWALADWQTFGKKQIEQQAETAPGSGVQAAIKTDLAAAALIAEAPILSDPTAATGDPVATPWTPHFYQPGAAAAATTSDGKKAFLILEVSGYVVDPTVVDTETATAGATYMIA